MPSKTRKTADGAHFEEFMAQRIMLVIAGHELPKFRGTYYRSQDEAVIQQLVSAGCDRHLLLDSIAFAGALEQLVKWPAHSKLACWSSNAVKLIEDLEAMFPRVSLLHVCEDGAAVRGHSDGEITVEAVPICGDMVLPSNVRAEWLGRALMMNHLADEARARQVPNKVQLAALAYLWPCFYVRTATGKPHHKQLMQLLGVNDASRLSTAMAKAARRHGPLIDFMLFSLERLPCEGQRQSERKTRVPLKAVS